MTFDRRISVQRALNALGYTAGIVDGSFGPATREAIARWQSKAGVQATG